MNQVYLKYINLPSDYFQKWTYNHRLLCPKLITQSLQEYYYTSPVILMSSKQEKHSETFSNGIILQIFMFNIYFSRLPIK